MPLVQTQTCMTPRHAAVIRGGNLEATVVPSLACVCASLTHHGTELLWRRADLEAYAHGGLIGISLLHPWAGRLVAEGVVVQGRELALGPGAPVTERDDVNGLVLDGLQARVLPFTVVSAGASWLSAILDPARAPALFAAFPFVHRLEITLSLDRDGLTVETTLQAGPDPVPVAFGYRPLFAFPDSPRADWGVELPLGRRVPLDERQLPVGDEVPVSDAGGVLGHRDFDDLFAGAHGPLAVEAGGRRIELHLLDGYEYVQVWAPSEREAISLGPMTAPTNALRTGRGLRVLGPGERHLASFRIAVS